MNSTLLNIFRFLILIILQVLIFNNINLFGYLNPYPYILFILLFPINGNKSSLLFFSFLLGLILDMFSNSGGIHAASATILAFVRPSLFKFSFGISYEYQTIKIVDKISSERITFLVTSVFIHHFVMFSLEYFRFSLILNVLLKTLLSTFFTVIVCLILIFLIKPNKR
ncbi:rod shape-determining protein MreD [Flavobacterium okayamense]|uniref:Rod shape-determining protein MreD n=1 Tax=Flavobacterium okayamense TaxID=2830782 RepID=A0ABM7S191_9FLAO|nr:rod shape-determining protein MreD [Flavobacterium okayamense]BCY27492.1 rod shape-determining protein MreD [Flavobacterium okayamense]